MMRNDATAIVGSVMASPSGLAMAVERPEVERMTSSLSQPARELEGITPRTGFVSVLSRTLGALVLAGGQDLQGELTNQIWLVPQWDEPFLLETPGYQPQTVLAATVATADGMLWVLDEYRLFGWLRVARLVRIDTLSGKHELVWQGPRLGIFDRHWLAVDRDGQVLLFGSSQRLRKHVTVRFEADPFVLGSAKPRLMRFDGGDLLGQPLVDAHGYQFVTRRGRKRLDVQRIESLDEALHHAIDLKECM